MNETLPVWEKKSLIVETIAENQVTIIVAETGAGKSTQVPQYLLEAGYSFMVTQPRILAARSVAERVASEYGCEFGKEVGYRTAHERNDNPKTRCLFCTDGLALAHELYGKDTFNLVVLDEVHEWTINIETLVAWYKRVIDNDPEFKLVLMSATINAEVLSQYFNRAPIISVPGRLFPVTEEKPQGPSLEDDVIRFLKEGRNVLVFQPGKKEIALTVDILRSSGVNAEILPLHGELSPLEQAKCFQSYKLPKCVVATNVAETSVTIEDVDVVVDSGMEKRIEVVDGVEGLYLKAISYANSKQRKGRAGRCKEGVYVDWCPENERLEFPIPEMLRARLDQTVLRLAENGYNMEELEFFHQPDLKEIHRARESLKALGLIDSRNGKVTGIGSKVAAFPVSVNLGRMIIEADKRGVVADLLKIAAILEIGGITMRNKSNLWRQFCPSETTSDVMAQLAVYNAVHALNPKPEWEDIGVFGKNVERVKLKFVQLMQVVKDKVAKLSSTGDRDAIIQSICSGFVDNVYMYQSGEWEKDDKYRRLANESVVRRARDLIVGIPFDIPRGEGGTVNLIQMATAINIDMLVEVAPHLVEIFDSDPYYEESHDSVAFIREVVFNGRSFGQHEVLIKDHPEKERLKKECGMGF